MKKKVICLMLLVISCLSSVIITNYLKPNNTNNNLIAVYYEDEDGNYQKTNNKTFYKEGYALDNEKSTCTNGSIIEQDNKTSKIKIKGNKTDNCNIYLSKKKYTLLTQNTEIINKDVTLTNMIKNGSYENEFTYWEQYPNNLCDVSDEKSSHGNHSLKFNINSENERTSANTWQIIDEKPINNHNYYARLKFLSSNNFSSIDSRFEWWSYDRNDGSRESEGYTILTFSYKNIKTIEWKLLSGINKLISGEYVNYPWQLRNFLVGATDIAYSDELMMIDLTKSYGENIPTKKWLDKNLIYFDDTVDMKTTIGKEGIFEVKDTAGTFRCNEDGSARIENGKVVITGTNVNTTCILE